MVETVVESWFVLLGTSDSILCLLFLFLIEAPPTDTQRSWNPWGTVLRPQNWCGSEMALSYYFQRAARDSSYHLLSLRGCITHEDEGPSCMAYGVNNSNENPRLRPRNLLKLHQVSYCVDCVTGREISLGLLFSHRAKCIFLEQLESSDSDYVAECPLNQSLWNLCWVLLRKLLRDTVSLVSWSLTREYNSQPLGLSVGPESILPAKLGDPGVSPFLQGGVANNISTPPLKTVFPALVPWETISTASWPTGWSVISPWAGSGSPRTPTGIEVKGLGHSLWKREPSS